MDLEELFDRRRKLEGDIAVAIYDPINQFREKTGLSISSVSVNFVRVTSHEDKWPVFVPSGITCHIAFED